MIPTPLTPVALQNTMQQVTMSALGTTNPNVVRVGWQPQGQPAWPSSLDVAIVRCEESSDPYDKIRDQANFPNDVESLIQQYRYTRVWTAYWCVYGPNSFDNVRKIRSALVTDPYTTWLLANVNTYVISEIRTPIYAPEKYARQWWYRTDFEARFCELVIEQQQVATVASVEINIEFVP